MADKRPSEIKALLDEQTVQQFFDEVDKKFTQEAERWTNLLKESANKYAKEQEKALEAIADKLTAIEKTNVKNIADYKNALAEENAKLDKERALELQNSIYKKQVELDTKSGKKRLKEELIAQKEINEAWIKKYEQLDKEGKLSDTQREDLNLKREQVNQANQEIAQGFKRNVLMKALNGLISKGLNSIDSAVNTYVKYQSGFNARIQGAGVGSVNLAERLKYGFNTFGILESRLLNATGTQLQPYVKTEKMVENLSELVNQGIAANVEQRAFLATVKDNIATTFDVANSSLLRIVRLQQSDSTAARLGMEAYLTHFLNGLVANTEYLNDTFDSVSDALIEASSQMSMKASTEFEFIVQKWLGALTGTGLSESTATSIAQAIGYLGSGNISGLESSSMQNLLVMAASRAGLDYSTLLTQGLNASNTNQLMRALSEYMVELGGSGNNVVRSQLAQTFGLSISDLTAARQLQGDFDKLSKTSLGFLGMYNELGKQVSAMPGRMSIAEMMQNVLDNSFFGLASNIASNPALASIWKVTSMIQEATGGINIPEAWAQAAGFGGGFSLNTSLENLVKLGVVGQSTLGMIGDVISSLGSTLMPSSMLLKLGISPLTTGIRRGYGLNQLTSGFTNSISALVGNASGADIASSVLAGAESEGQKKLDEKQAEQQEKSEQPEKQIQELLEAQGGTTFTDIRDLLNDIKTQLARIGIGI